jgi:acetyl esterase
VYFHGGGWVWANVDTHDRMTREYAAAGPVAVVSVDYALSPEAKFPQAPEECAAVVRFVSAHGAEWGLDPARILVGGDSAGGNLALATALLLRDEGGPALTGVLANYPVSDSRFDTPSYRESRWRRRRSPAWCMVSCARPGRCRNRGMQWRWPEAWMRRVAGG